MLPRMWLNRIFSFNDFRCQFLSLWITAWRQAPLEIWNLGTILYFPLSPSIPTKTHSASMCHKWTQQVHLFFFFFLIRFVVQWNNSPFQWRETQETSAKNGKKYLENRVWKNMDCISPSERFESHIYLNYWVKRTITTGDLRRDLKKEKVAKIMFSFISWNLHEGWDEWFHYHSTHQQQETP